MPVIRLPNASASLDVSVAHHDTVHMSTIGYHAPDGVYVLAGVPIIYLGVRECILFARSMHGRGGTINVLL